VTFQRDTSGDHAVDVVLVEDHPTFRLGLRTRLELEQDITVIGEAGSGEAALALVSERLPDVAVVDLGLPGMDGITLTSELAVRSPGVHVLVLSMLDDESVFAAVRAGARGYLLKDADPSQIVSAIRSVAAGHTVFSAGVARRLLALADQEATAAPALFPDFSRREIEILTLVAEGLTNTEIGRRLELRPKTVRNYVSNVIGKLQATDRAEAILRARRAGLGDRR
jgi:DNA-binding NarL/FixJ family response regulator